MKWCYLLILSILLIGCSTSELYSDERIEKSQEIISIRSEEAASLTLKEKAEFFEKRILEEYIIDPFYVIARNKEQSIIGDIEETALFLSALAFKYDSTQDKEIEELAKKIIKGIISMDKANGFDGYLPKEVIVKDNELVILKNNVHINVYSQLLFAYTHAYLLFEDPELKQMIQDHVLLISEYFLENDFVLKNEKGEIMRYSDLSPKSFTFKKNRQLDLLLILESGLVILDETGFNMEDFRSKKKELLDRYKYYQSIQRLHLKIGIFEFPSHSSDWLNFLKLHALISLTDEENYKNAFMNLYKSQQREENPLFQAMYLDIKEDISPEEKELVEKSSNYYLSTFPLNLSNAEIINSHNKDIQKKIRFIKLKKVVEAETPLPIFMRPLKGHEWKRNAFRLNGNILESGNKEYPGTDFLLAYWMMEKNNKI